MNAAQPPAPGTSGEVDDDPTRLLAFVRDRHRARVLADRDVFVAAAAWAEAHSADSITAADWMVGSETARPMAGEGCPLVAEFCVAELAAVIGRSTDSGRRLIGQALEVRHRLPSLWTQVVAGRLETWRAGTIADATMALNPAAAAWVDVQVAPIAHKVGGAQLGRRLGEAIARFDPDLAEKERRTAMDGRRFEIRFGQTGGLGSTGSEGVVHHDGCLDYADARDLDLAVRQGAADLAALGSAESLDVRRAQAVGALARRDLTLDLNPDLDGDDGAEPAPAVGSLVRAVAARQVVIYAHLSAAAIRGAASTDLARVEGHGWVGVEQVRSWCGADAQVVIRPVIDTTGHVAVDAYEVPDRLKAQVEMIDPACVFPWCTRASRRCDHDHIQSRATDGPTCGCNIAPLCRYHHRLKTHTGWTYDRLDIGTYLWRSPHGHQLRRDPTGTTLMDPGCRGHDEDPPEP